MCDVISIFGKEMLLVCLTHRAVNSCIVAVIYNHNHNYYTSCQFQLAPHTILPKTLALKQNNK